MDTDQDLTAHKCAVLSESRCGLCRSFVLSMNRYRNFTRHTCPMRHRVIFQKQLSVMLAHNGIDDIQSHTIVRLCSRAALILHIELLLPPLKRLPGKTRSRIRYSKDQTASHESSTCPIRQSRSACFLTSRRHKVRSVFRLQTEVPGTDLVNPISICT